MNAPRVGHKVGTDPSVCAIVALALGFRREGRVDLLVGDAGSCDGARGRGRPKVVDGIHSCGGGGVRLRCICPHKVDLTRASDSSRRDADAGSAGQALGLGEDAVGRERGAAGRVRNIRGERCVVLRPAVARVGWSGVEAAVATAAAAVVVGGKPGRALGNVNGGRVVTVGVGGTAVRAAGHSVLAAEQDERPRGVVGSAERAAGESLIGRHDELEQCEADHRNFQRRRREEGVEQATARQQPPVLAAL